MTVALLDHAPLELGEGPRWDAARRRMFLVDILGGQILRRGHGDAVFTMTAAGGHVGAVAPVADDGARVLAAIDHGVALVGLATGHRTWLAEPERARRGEVRMNDGACDPQGRFVVGSMDYEERVGAGRLWRIDGAGGAEQLLAHCTVPNGLVWSDDGAHLFHVDSGPGTITRYRYGDDGLADPHVIYRAGDDDGAPDGMCADSEGTLWVAFWGGACVRRLTAEGQVLATMPLPMAQTSACAFVGPDLDRLLVTSARSGLEDPRPEDGRSAIVDPGVTGVPATPFMLEAPATGA